MITPEQKVARNLAGLETATGVLCAAVGVLSAMGAAVAQVAWQSEVKLYNSFGSIDTLASVAPNSIKLLGAAVVAITGGAFIGVDGAGRMDALQAEVTQSE
ncbi:MAG: hypothetical protein ABIQ89_00265 [Candidatus Saccharimonadales bacterium]